MDKFDFSDTEVIPNWDQKSYLQLETIAKNLGTIKGILQFFLIITILSMVVAACSVLL